MNITVNQKNQTAEIILTKRGLELLAGLIGNSTAYGLAQSINSSSIVKDKTNISEVQQYLGSAAYRELSNAVEALSPKILKVVEFVYDKQQFGENPKWRTVHVTEENGQYIEGLEDGVTFKRFLKSRILGGRVITVK
jgi:hypothetical protein